MRVPDPIVEEVRAIRDRIAKEFGYDIDRLGRELQRRQAMNARPVVRLRQSIAASRAGLSSVRGSGRLPPMSPPLPRITVDPRVCGGQPCVRGLRIPVSLVLKHLAAGQTPEQVVDEFPELEVADIRECLKYAAWLASGRSVDVSPAA